MSTFSAIWRDCFGNSEPIGYRLREDFPDRWFRIHSLPNSKRYADTSAERSILLERANRLGDTVLGGRAPCWMIASYPSDVNDPNNVNDLTSEPRKTKEDFALPYSHVWSDLHEAPADRFPWECFAASTTWESGKFNAAILRIADDEEDATLWFSPERASVFAPYDGGVDVIVGQGSGVNRLERQYRDWMSDRADWL
jgi:hypothetical protein